MAFKFLFEKFGEVVADLERTSQALFGGSVAR